HLAGGVADNQGRAGIGLGLLNGLQGLGGVGTHGHLSHVDIAVTHGDLRQGLFLDLLAGRGELRHLADVGRLGGLAAGIGVHLGIKDEDIHIVAGGQDVVQTAEADVVGPAVAAEDPHGLLGQELLVRQNLSSQLAGVALAQRLALCLQLLAEGMDLRLGIGQQLVHSADAALQG
ncbi:Phage tail protein, partial [Dysosmobacter welbionis]